MSAAEDKPAGALWGLAATLAWGTVIGLVYVYVQVVGIGFYIGLRHADAAGGDFERLFGQYQYHGMALSYGLFAAAFVCIPLILAAIGLKQRSELKGYLGLKRFSGATFARWGGAILALAAAFDLLQWLGGQPIVPEFMTRIYASAAGSALLWLAVVIVAPATEEMLFRGFLLPGLAASVLGPVGAIVLTSLVWAAFHVQYDLLQMGFIFVVGLLLGWARYETGSLPLTFALHALMNLAAMLLTAVTLSA